MIRSFKNSFGATLLEVMLVLSIVSLIILMSVRYYQATSTSSQVQQVMSAAQAITAASDNLSLGSAGGYSNATASNITAIAGSNALVAPGGGTISVTGGTATSYKVSIPSVPTNVCSVVSLKLKTNKKYTQVSCSGGAISYVYDNTQQ